jgi:uncharacterized protein YqeY
MTAELPNVTIMLEKQINEQLKAAMLARDEKTLRALRAIKAGILLAKTSEGAGGELKPEDEVKMLQKMVKQRRDAEDIFRQQNRVDLADKEAEEIAVIERFLPKQMNAAELKEALRGIIASVGASSPQDMGKVMGAATKELAGKADGKAISAAVRELLSNPLS